MHQRSASGIRESNGGTLSNFPRHGCRWVGQLNRSGDRFASLHPFARRRFDLRGGESTMPLRDGSWHTISGFRHLNRLKRLIDNGLSPTISSILRSCRGADRPFRGMTEGQVLGCAIPTRMASIKGRPGVPRKSPSMMAAPCFSNTRDATRTRLNTTATKRDLGKTASRPTLATPG
jgi:hypothetical protein